MRVLFFLILIVFFFFGCNLDQKKISEVVLTDSISVKKDTLGKPFFDFDEIIHYQINMTDKEFDELDRKGPQTEYEQKLWGILTSLNPYDIQGTKFWTDFYDIQKVERPVKEKYFEKLRNEIFIEKKCDNIYATACVPIYRDILIFNKANKIKGVAKICFKCRMYNFQATAANVECFGMNGEYEMLEKIFEENNKQ